MRPAVPVQESRGHSVDQKHPTFGIEDEPAMAHPVERFE
jgi:hypothetical protein